MRYLLRHRFTLGAVVSLAVWASVCVLWARSRNAGTTLGYASVGGKRYGLHSYDGRLHVAGPPAGAASTPIRNDRVRWFVHRPAALWRPSWTEFVSFSVDGGVPPTNLSTRQLLSDLESPDTFVTAHVLLVNRSVNAALPVVSGTNDLRSHHIFSGQNLQLAGAVTLADFAPRSSATKGNIDGLEVVFTRGKHSDRYFGKGRRTYEVYEAAAVIAPEQRQRILDQWHRRLDVPMLSIPYSILSACASIAPGWWAIRRLTLWRRRRSWVKQSRCRACGYDLRASPSRCPECGLPAGLQNGIASDIQSGVPLRCPNGTN